MAGTERLCHIFEWGRELISYFEMGSRNEKGWEPLLYANNVITPCYKSYGHFIIYLLIIAQFF